MHMYCTTHENEITTHENEIVSRENEIATREWNADAHTAILRLTTHLVSASVHP